MDEFLDRAKNLVHEELIKMTNKERYSKLRSFPTEKDWIKLLKMFYLTYLDPKSYYILVPRPTKQLRSFEIKSGLGIDQTISLPMFIVSIILKEFYGVNSEAQSKKYFV